MKSTLGLGLLVCIGLITQARAQQGVVLIGGTSLATFTVGTPSAGIPVAVTGLNAGESLVGIDFRPVNRTLVGVTTQSRLVALNSATGAATLLSTLSSPLSGTAFGVDFNPVPDRLRVISNTGQNFRINVDTGAVTTDGALAYASDDSGAGRPTSVAGAGYTNSVAGRLATTTTLYDIDYDRDVLVVQNPPNDGVLRTVGPLGLDTSAVVGFDVFSPGVAFASLVVGGSPGLYRINLSTGAATLVNALPAGTSDLALTPKEPALAIVNTSARGLVTPGDGALISGFVIQGSQPVTVLMNVRGPSLTAFGLTNVLTDTRLQVYRGATLVEQNDDWTASPRASEITASGFAPGSTKESSVLITLDPGAYTAVVNGIGTATGGVAIVEVYELP
ncbi:MAG: DUF4394 domain-containing protein [Opitutaceae bacterium]|nr:DUF4394 domain-containing protein [Opitutaceae bacterium]